VDWVPDQLDGGVVELVSTAHGRGSRSGLGSHTIVSGGNVNRSTTAARIVVLDSHALFAECLCLGLCQRGHHAVAVEPPPRLTSVAVMLAPALRERPDIAIVNIARTPTGDGIRLVHPLTLAGVHVVVVTEDTDRIRWGHALTLGARAVVAKEAPFATITAAVRRLSEGTGAMPAEERRALMEHYRVQRAADARQRELLEKLTQRESEILSNLMSGRAVREIARRDVVSEATVRSQVKSLLAKLDVPSQLAAVALAASSGWVPCEVGRDELRTPPSSRSRSAAS
jgi:two-component system, NarL family, nitrate/nitrite response regulator NarL